MPPPRSFDGAVKTRLQLSPALQLRRPPKRGNLWRGFGELFASSSTAGQPFCTCNPPRMALRF